MQWQQFFTDPNLEALIETALQNNQELNITLQEIEIARNEIRARKGEYLPFVGLGGRGRGWKKWAATPCRAPRRSSIDIQEDRRTPDPLTNSSWARLPPGRSISGTSCATPARPPPSATWPSVEGKNFMVTNLIAEIANSYYELLALDNQLAIVQQNIGIQTNALELVRLQKESARAHRAGRETLRGPGAEHPQPCSTSCSSSIVETENQLNFLVGRYPQPVVRNDQSFNDLLPPGHPGRHARAAAGQPPRYPAGRAAAGRRQAGRAGGPRQLLPLAAPDRRRGPGGLQARPCWCPRPSRCCIRWPAIWLAPLFNRNGIKAIYYNANALQTQAVYRYERTVLNAYVEVANQLSNISNLAAELRRQSQGSGGPEPVRRHFQQPLPLGPRRLHGSPLHPARRPGIEVRPHRNQDAAAECHGERVPGPGRRLELIARG